MEPFNWEALLPQKRLLRVQEVARFLDCSVDHVYNLLDEGALRVAVDIRTSAARRGCARVLRDSVLEFLRHADFALR